MIWSDFRQVATVILLIVGALLPVVNPLGDAPLFLAMTAGYDEAVRAFLARRIAVYSFALLLGSMLIGGLVLRVFGLSRRSWSPTVGASGRCRTNPEEPSSSSCFRRRMI